MDNRYQEVLRARMETHICQGIWYDSNPIVNRIEFDLQNDGREAIGIERNGL